MKRKNSPDGTENRHGGQFRTGKPILAPVRGETVVSDRQVQQPSNQPERVVSSKAITPEAPGITGLPLFRAADEPEVESRVLGAHPKADGSTVIIIAAHDFVFPSTLPRNLMPTILKPLLAVLAEGFGTAHAEVTVQQSGLSVRPFDIPIRHLGLNYSPPIRQSLETVYRWGGNRYPQIAEVGMTFYDHLKLLKETIATFKDTMLRFDPIERVDFQLERITKNVYELRNLVLRLKYEGGRASEFVAREIWRRSAKMKAPMELQARPLFASRYPILAAVQRQHGQQNELLLDRPEGISHVHWLSPELLLHALQSIPPLSQMRREETVNSRPLPPGVVTRNIVIQRSPFALVITHRYAEAIGVKTVGTVRKGSRIFYAKRNGREGYSRFSYGVEVVETRDATFVVGFQALQGFADVKGIKFDLPRHHFANLLTAHTGLSARREYWKVRGPLSDADVRQSEEWWLGSENTPGDRGHAFYPVPGTYEPESIVRVIGGRKAELEFLRKVSVREPDKRSTQD